MDNLFALLQTQAAPAAEVQPEHQERRQLRRERLGRSHSDLRPRVEIDAPLGLAGDGTSYRVDDADHAGTPGLGDLDGLERVGGLTGLRDGDHERLLERYAALIAKLRRVLDLHR